jgi:hypothetical protein
MRQGKIRLTDFYPDGVNFFVAESVSLAQNTPDRVR